MKLLIVESPSKTKKIAQYLGDGWHVAASFGHVRDLPVAQIGVSPPSYEPTYEIAEKSKATVAKLRSLAKKADEIYLAPDPDREGEAIAWHLAELLCKNKIYKRVTFNEITESAVKKAINNPRLIDENLFQAQQGRRVLDRLYGYKLSPELSNKINQYGVSAGRVQSVALRLIVDRERSIRNFVSTKHYCVKLIFDNWSAYWDTSDLLNDENQYITDKTVAESVCEVVDRSGVIIKSFVEKEESRKPPAPLITSTLQQASANTLKMSVSDTMKAAQKLFELGLITYHRTDNPNLSEESIELIWDFLRSAGQSIHIPDKSNKWKSKADAQEAHEAIRPTDFNRRTADTGDAILDKLYLLIWRVAVGSQMKSAIYKVRKAVLESNDIVKFPESKKAIFNASGRELIYHGWLILNKDDYTNEDSNTDDNLPILQVNEIVKQTSVKLLEKQTKPKKRYSETALVKMLERKGIGRPSTYASIIQVLLNRSYVEIKARQFEPTKLGEAIVDALVNRFAIMETAYTSEMESELDAIAHGKATYLEVMLKYDTSLNAELNEFKNAQIKPFGNDKTVSCPECKDGQLRRKKGKYGFFWGCSNYSNGCQCMRNDVNGMMGEAKEKKEFDETHKCPHCETGYLQRRKSKKGYFWGCSNYSNGCKYTTYDEDGQPKEK